MADDLETDLVVCHLQTSPPSDLPERVLLSYARTCIDDYVSCEHSSLASSSLSSSSGSNPDPFCTSNYSDDELFGDGTRNISSNSDNVADKEDGVTSLINDMNGKLLLSNSENTGNVKRTLNNSTENIISLAPTTHKGTTTDNPEVPADQIEVVLAKETNTTEQLTVEEIIDQLNSISVDDEDRLFSKGRASQRQGAKGSRNVYKGKDLGVRKEYQNAHQKIKTPQFGNNQDFPTATNDYSNLNSGSQTSNCVPPPLSFPYVSAKDVEDFLKQYPTTPQSKQNAAGPLPPISSFSQPWMDLTSVNEETFSSQNPYMSKINNDPSSKCATTEGQPRLLNRSCQLPTYNGFKSQNINSASHLQNFNSGTDTSGYFPVPNINSGTHAVNSRGNINSGVLSCGQYPHLTCNNQLFEQPSSPNPKVPPKSPELNLPLVIYDVEYRKTPSRRTSSSGAFPTSPSSSEGTSLSPARSFTSSESSPFHDTTSRSSVNSPAVPNDTLTAPNVNGMSLDEGDASPQDDVSDTESELDNGNNQLFEFAFKNDVMQMRTIENLNDLSSLINEKNRDGQTPLYYCVKHGNETAVKILLELGSDPKLLCHRRDSRKIDMIFIENALHLACEKGFINIVRLLLRRCLDADFVNRKRDGDGLTPFMLALTEHSLRQDRTEIIFELLRYDIDLSIIDRKTGRNALMMAINKRALNIAQDMLEHMEVKEQRVQVTHKDYCGNTCLHMLAETNPSDDSPPLTRDRIRNFCLTLTRCGADLNARNNEDLTPKDYCHDLMMQIGRRT